MMDKGAFFQAAALRQTKVVLPDTDIEVTLNELSAADQEKLFESAGDGLLHTAAMTVALSCPDFSLNDVDKLKTETRSEVLAFLSEKIYDLSGMSEGAKHEAKKD